MKSVSTRDCAGVSVWTFTLSFRPTTARGSSVTPMSAATQPIMPSRVPSSSRRRPAELREHLFEPLPVRAAGAEDERGRSGFRRARAQGGEILPSPRRDQHQFFAEGDGGIEFGMLDRTGNERAVERTVQHARHQLGGRRRPQAQSHLREAAMKFGKQGR